MKKAIANRKQALEVKGPNKGALDLSRHVPFQVAVVSNLLSLDRDPVIRSLTELNTRELRVLLNVGSYAPVTAAEVSYQSRLDPYSVTRAVNTLLKLELVRATELTGKSKPVILTEAGEKIYREVSAHVRKREAMLTAHMSEDEKAQLSTLLIKLELTAEEILANEVTEMEEQGQAVTRDHKEMLRWYKRSRLSR
ncbi:MarR family transcriptional regulator [Pseudoalteromonas sp. OOF1S-7]|uniref:MarR family winged helix-turn-helix transcriptional regulator n=1 Tax=Pseudoalteromonas sp. OOF1S-7 TaxID=2917757 RepID=UPI001EF4C3BF|nr:MarR family transcriptional regulator [Pseudoalteromonas sp. OOF1S-7]MCG7535430.1 MarR family transcriptional regulator [Pseudoalteromonas sp. OOF1S-7]